MKKKFRAINIDGDNWAWMFKTKFEGGQTLKIWCEKKLVFKNYYYYNSEKKKYKIKPSLIARFIKTYLKK
jgi:hypothetical protein